MTSEQLDDFEHAVKTDFFAGLPNAEEMLQLIDLARLELERVSWPSLHIKELPVSPGPWWKLLNDYGAFYLRNIELREGEPWVSNGESSYKCSKGEWIQVPSCLQRKAVSSE